MAKTPSTTDNNPTSALYAQSAYFPWQTSVWNKLFTQHFSQMEEAQHFPHALLLAGIAGIGKKQLAFYLAKALLCQSPEYKSQSGQIEPCLSCRSCLLFHSGNHPDLYHITTPEDKKVIPVDDIRELIQWSVLSSQYGGKKIIIIEPAEAMNLNAANSLLKTLEEPVADTIIILLTNKKQALLATIRSRCQTIDLALPERQLAIHWLEQSLMPEKHNAQLLLSLSSGAPLLALDLARGEQLEFRRSIFDDLFSIINELVDPVKIAEALFKQTKGRQTKGKRTKTAKKQLYLTPYDVIYWMDSMVSDVARFTHNCAHDTISNIDYYDDLKLLSNRLYLKRVLQLSDLINKAYYEIQGSVNINLLFENLLIDWKNCKK